MKPRVFIGSSAESISVAYAIQDNLTYDANVTIWSQGIFQLSSNTLDDLLKAVANSDYAIFVFKHDDKLKIRNASKGAVRDNVIFEFGLFIGRLGRENVFFVIPNGEKDFHVPTDLMGVTPGVYDESREDGNMHAALGPFCNQIRMRLKEFVYENLNDLTNESIIAKKIAVEKKDGWEFYLFAEMLEQRLIPINQSYLEIDKGLVFLKTRICTGVDFKNYYLELSSDLQKLISLLFKLLLEESTAAFGPPGVAGKILDIKNVADKFYYLCKELIAWEYRLSELQPPDMLTKVKEIIKNWSRKIIAELNKFPNEVRRNITEQLQAENKESVRKISFTLNIDESDSTFIIQAFEKFFMN